MKKIINRICKKCFLPLTVGGKINSLKNAETFIRSGADKLVINSAIYNNSSIIKKITELLNLKL